MPDPGKVRIGISGWTYERLSGKIFLVAGLLAYKHQLAVDCTLAENGLRAELP